MSALAPPGTIRLARGERSVLVVGRCALTAAGLAVLTLAAAALALASGLDGVRPLTALQAAFGAGSAQDVLLVRTLRLPRVEAGLLVGAALGVAGLLLQTIARNRLATPEYTGVNDGATAFAVASIVAVPTSIAPSAMALAGGATAAALTLALAGGAGTRGYRFIVIGIGVGAVGGALTNLILARGAIDAANAAYIWTVGALDAAAPTAVSLLALGLAVLLPVAIVLARRLALMRLPERVAAGLGVRVQRIRLAALAVAVALAALTVAVAGPVGMVALAAPEAARTLAGPRAVPVVSSALAGAAMVVLADLIGRVLLGPIEIPVGLVTAVVGGPYLLYVLVRGRPLEVA